MLLNSHPSNNLNQNSYRKISQKCFYCIFRDFYHKANEAYVSKPLTFMGLFQDLCACVCVCDKIYRNKPV